MARSWETLLAEWHRLEGSAIETRWRQADLLKEVDRGELSRFAAAVKREESTLRSWRRTAEAFPNARARAFDVPWTVYVELRNQPGLVRDGMSVDEARRAAGTTPSRPTYADLSVDERVRRSQEALRDRAVADRVMEDPQVRLRARAAAERQASAARAQAESERKAHAYALREDTPDVVDGRALMELGAALGRVIGTARAAAEIWRRWEPKISAEAREAAIDDIGGTQARIDAILDAMRGADLDTALAKILAETEEGA
jgi:hypothetical protein